LKDRAVIKVTELVLRASLNIFVGEMDPPELRDCLFNPSTRRLLRVTLDDVNKALALASSSSARRDLMVERGIFGSIPFTTQLYEQDSEIKVEGAASFAVF